MTITSWDMNSVQFPRLLAELRDLVTQEQLEELCDSMDLEPMCIDEVFDRADAEWQILKNGFRNKR